MGSSQDIQEFLDAFKQVFKGRTDVVPRYWKSKDGKKSGYAPICSNEWKGGICRKPCRTCPNALYVPLSDELLTKHFFGKHIIGIYPLLTDNTCFFAAADFDDHHENGEPRNPLRDATEFHAVCEVQGLPAYLERSKSGKGLHAWVFFDSAVPAWKARIVMFALLREAGVIGDSDKLSSFDRLFPNQDRHSGKGFGNLIAAPFQGKAAKAGHTLFLDPATDFREPYKDQTAILKGIQRATESDLDRIIQGWDLKGESTVPRGPAKEQNGDSPLFQCGFIRYCRDNPATLPEPLWYAMISNVARTTGGISLCHQLSQEHPGYSAAETNQKMMQALDASGPHTCAWIKSNGFDCGQACGVKAPVGLIHRALSQKRNPL